MNIKEHETLLLLEEVSELIEASTRLQTELFKNLRFGDTAEHPVTGKNTIENIVREANDVLANLQRLKKYSQFQGISDIDAITEKTNRVNDMIVRSCSLGVIDLEKASTATTSPIPPLFEDGVYIPINEFLEGLPQGKFGTTDGIGQWYSPVVGLAGLTDVTQCPDWATDVYWRNFKPLNNKEENHG